MKVLVTGGQGFIGQHVCRALVCRHHEVVSVDNFSAPNASRQAMLGTRVVNADIENCIPPVGLFENERFDVIIHLAAMSRVVACQQDKREALRVNVDGTKRVWSWAREEDARLIFISTCICTYNPVINFYAQTKWHAEKFLQETDKVPTEILRLYNVYGPGMPDEGNHATLLGRWKRLKAKKKPLTIYGDGEQTRDFIHVEDVSDIICDFAENPPKNMVCVGQPWDIGTGWAWSINRIAEEVDPGNRLGRDHQPLPTAEIEHAVAAGENKRIIGKRNYRHLEDYLEKL